MASACFRIGFFKRRRGGGEAEMVIFPPSLPSFYFPYFLYWNTSLSLSFSPLSPHRLEEFHEKTLNRHIHTYTHPNPSQYLVYSVLYIIKITSTLYESCPLMGLTTDDDASPKTPGPSLWLARFPPRLKEWFSTLVMILRRMVTYRTF